MPPSSVKPASSSSWMAWTSGPSRAPGTAQRRRQAGRLVQMQHRVVVYTKQAVVYTNQESGIGSPTGL